jgi:hypothetical protein
VNEGEQAHWYDSPGFFDRRRTGRGWVVRFAMARDGTRPALEYLRNTDSETGLTVKDRDRFAGIFGAITVSGPDCLGGKVFRKFVGADASDEMYEIRHKQHMGHRLLCFKRPGQVLIVATGFRKPNQKETPPSEKGEARRVLEEHLAREAEEAKRSGTGGRRGGGVHD